jgi:hypothetical protein
MAETPASARESTPLRRILDNLNRPDVDLEEEQAGIDENVVLADLSSDGNNRAFPTAENACKNLSKNNANDEEWISNKGEDIGAGSTPKQSLAAARNSGIVTHSDRPKKKNSGQNSVDSSVESYVHDASTKKKKGNTKKKKMAPATKPAKKKKGEQKAKKKNPKPMIAAAAPTPKAMNAPESENNSPSADAHPDHSMFQ